MSKETAFPLSTQHLDRVCHFQKFEPVFSRERDEEQIPEKVKEDAACEFLEICERLDLDPRSVVTERAKEEIENTVHDYPDQGFQIERLSHNKKEFDERSQALLELERACQVLKLIPRDVIISEAARKLQQGQFSRFSNVEVEIAQLARKLIQEKVDSLEKYRQHFRKGRIVECWYVFPRFIKVSDGKIAEVLF
jgi:hypothetical protein